MGQQVSDEFYKGKKYSQWTTSDPASWSTSVAKKFADHSDGIQGNWCVVQAEGGAVRWRADGTAPTSTVGMLLGEGADITISLEDVDKMQFIQADAAAQLNIHWFNL